MKVIFSGTLSAEAVRLASQVAGLSQKNGSFDVGAWFFPEGSEPGLVDGESLSLDSFDILDLSSPQFSKETLALYRQLMSREDFVAHTALILKLFNRRDFTGSFRLLEREVFAQNATLTAIEYLFSKQPDLVVFPVTPHLAMPSIVSYVCDFLGIPVLYMQPCPLGPAVFPILVDELGGRYAEIPSEVSLPDGIRNIASRELKALASFRDPTYMQLQRKRDSELDGWRRRIMAFLRSLRWLWSDRYSQAVDFSGFVGKKFFLKRPLQLFITRKLQSELRTRAMSLAVTKKLPESYCLFALHYEPERTSLPDGLPILFQPDAVAIARAIVPSSTTLIVKEHYSQTSSALRGFLGRSPHVYELLEKYENLNFAAVNTYLSDLVDRATCVFTLTGTIAIESVLKGTPVAYFGSPWWHGMPGTIRIGQHTSFEDLTSIVVPKSSQVIEFLENQIGQRAIVGLGSESIDTLEKRLGVLPATLLEDEARSLSALIQTVLSKV